MCGASNLSYGLGGKTAELPKFRVVGCPTACGFGNHDNVESILYSSYIHYRYHTMTHCFTLIMC